MFGWIATGLEKVTCCQPLEVSPEKFACARRVPELVQRLPTWVPVFFADL